MELGGSLPGASHRLSWSRQSNAGAQVKPHREQDCRHIAARCSTDRLASNEPGIGPGYQSVSTGYWLTARSSVTKVIPSESACATRSLSNGSWWCSGSSKSARVCLS